MRVKDLMKTHVVSVKPENSVKHAAQIMLAKGISGLPVVDNDDLLVGMITEGDLLGRNEIGVELNRDENQGGKRSFTDRAGALVKRQSWKVADVMSEGVITIEEGATVGRAAALMNNHHVKRIPVTRDGRLIGIISRVDLLRLIATAEPGNCAPGDTAIKRSILTRLGETAFDDLVKLSVIVNEGVVHLWGNVRSTETKKAARVVSESVRGVAGVVDHTQLVKVGEDKELQTDAVSPRTS